jgi:hypothetical protein
MAVVLGAWLALSGLVPFLVGVASRERTRKLRRDGMTAWAIIVPQARQPADEAGSLTGGERISVQYTLADGRGVEQPVGAAGRKGSALAPGQRILIWYSADDPADILVYGREGRVADRVFTLLGAALLLAGALIAGFAP